MNQMLPEPQPTEPNEHAADNPLVAASTAKARLAGEKGVWMQATVVPMALIGVYLVVTGAGFTIYGAVTGGDHSPAEMFNSPLPLGVIGLILCAAEIATYRFLVGVFAKRPVSELAPKSALCETVLGIAIGAGLVSLPMLILWVSGQWQLVKVSVEPGIGLGIAMGLMSCVWEELLFRGVMVRLFDRMWGPVWAITMSTVVFGGLHLMNPGMTGLGVIALALSGGPLLGAAYLWKHRLWLPIGLHFGWNAMQGSFWGSVVSGTGAQHGLLQGVFDGPEWITGGSVGVEGSFLTACVCLIATCVILVWIRTHPTQQPAETPPSEQTTLPTDA